MLVQDGTPGRQQRGIDSGTNEQTKSKEAYCSMRRRNHHGVRPSSGRVQLGTSGRGAF